MITSPDANSTTGNFPPPELNNSRTTYHEREVDFLCKLYFKNFHQNLLNKHEKNKNGKVTVQAFEQLLTGLGITCEALELEQLKIEDQE
jgi:hypothetical protein